MCDIDPEGILVLVEQLTATGKTLQQGELDQAYRVVSACLATMRQRERRLRNRCSDMPLLQVYMSDGWTCEAAVHAVAKSVAMETMARREVDCLLLVLGLWESICDCDFMVIVSVW